MNLDYDNNKDGNKLRQIDGDAKVRALMRSKNLEQKNNGAYNIITGDQRVGISVPHHDRYNPLRSAASQVIVPST
jgi:hypothetical protein